MNKTYLGDGLYASDTGWDVVISTKREMDEHYIVLDPEVLESFFSFLEKSRNLKIEILKE